MNDFDARAREATVEAAVILEGATMGEARGRRRVPINL
jgi:hypothetical protein